MKNILAVLAVNFCVVDSSLACQPYLYIAIIAQHSNTKVGAVARDFISKYIHVYKCTNTLYKCTNQCTYGQKCALIRYHVKASCPICEQHNVNQSCDWSVRKVKFHTTTGGMYYTYMCYMRAASHHSMAVIM